MRQIDAPDRLYAHPADLFVASFIGSPPMNLAQATVRRDPDADALRVELAGLELPIHAEVLTDRPALARYVDRPVVLGIRPEDLLDAAEHDSSAGSGRIRAEVDLRESLGSEVYVHFMIDAPTVITEDTREVAADLGDEAVSDLERSAAAERTAFVARLDARAGAREGDRIELTVDPRGLHFFDPESGLSIGR